MLKSGIPNDVSETELSKLEDELKKDIDEKNINQMSVEQWSIKAKLHDIYLTAYTVLCDPVHTNVNDLERYLTLDQQGEIKELNFGPDSAGLRTLLMTNIECMLVAIKALSDQFKTERDDAINELNDRLKKITE